MPKSLLEINDSLTGAQPGFELSRIVRLSHVVISASIHPDDDRIRVGISRQKENVNVRAACPSDSSADFKPAHGRNSPIENRDLGPFIFLEDLPGFGAIPDNGHLVAAFS